MKGIPEGLLVFCYIQPTFESAINLKHLQTFLKTDFVTCPIEMQA